MNKPYLLFICLTLIKCNGPQARQEKQCVENLKFPELGKFFSQKIVYLLWITKKNIQKSRKKLTVWNFSDRKLSGRKLQNRKAFRKKVSFPKVYERLKKKAFFWFKKEKIPIFLPNQVDINICLFFTNTNKWGLLPHWFGRRPFYISSHFPPRFDVRNLLSAVLRNINLTRWRGAEATEENRRKCFVLVNICGHNNFSNSTTVDPLPPPLLVKSY